jgi:peptidoglycan/xylan/chitin deacetylase (PgdA/CDA1 family)
MRSSLIIKRGLREFAWQLDNVIRKRKFGRYILMYHSIDDNEEYFTVLPSQFKWQIKYLKKHISVVTLDSLIKSYIDGEILTKPQVAITFDDGYYDNYINAYPHLYKLNLPSTLFIPTALINKRNNKFTYINESQLKGLSEIGVSIQSHTVNHFNLDDLSYEDQYKEIHDSIERLEQITEETVKYLAYPRGRYNSDTIKAVQCAGIKAAFTVESSLLTEQSLFEIPRIDVNKYTTAREFIFKFSYGYEILSSNLIVNYLKKKGINLTQ